MQSLKVENDPLKSPLLKISRKLTENIEIKHISSRERNPPTFFNKNR